MLVIDDVHIVYAFPLYFFCVMRLISCSLKAQIGCTTAFVLLIFIVLLTLFWKDALLNYTVINAEIKGIWWHKATEWIVFYLSMSQHTLPFRLSAPVVNVAWRMKSEPLSLLLQAPSSILHSPRASYLALPIPPTWWLYCCGALLTITLTLNCHQLSHYSCCWMFKKLSISL